MSNAGSPSEFCIRGTPSLACICQRPDIAPQRPTFQQNAPSLRFWGTVLNGVLGCCPCYLCIRRFDNRNLLRRTTVINSIDSIYHTICHVYTSPLPCPPDQASQAQCSSKMKRYAPRHSKKILWAEHSPNEQMRPQHRTSHHHARTRNPGPHGAQSHMPHPSISALPSLLPFLLSHCHFLQVFSLFLHPVARVDLVNSNVATWTSE